MKNINHKSYNMENNQCENIPPMLPINDNCSGELKNRQLPYYQKSVDCFNGNYKEAILKQCDYYINIGIKGLIFFSGVFIGISLTLYFK